MDLTKQNKQTSGQHMTSDEYRHYLQEETISFLRKEKKYKILEFIGRGSYGDVFSVISPNYVQEVALKIVNCNDVWRGEILLWPGLKHPNLLPLLETVKLPSVYLFITPLMDADLENFLEEDYFLRNPEALQLVKKWLNEILVALSYLHQQKLCHLDVKADNVLLDQNLKALLCDFSFICGTRTFVNRYGVPMPYRPPEACLTYEKDIPVDGEKFEMWSYGMLAFNIFTGHILRKRLTVEAKNWHIDIYPLVYEAMQLHNFYTLMFDAFPRSEISMEEEMANALNFLHFLLRLEPVERPSVGSCAQHIFLVDGGYVMDKLEEHWIVQDLSDCKCPCLGQEIPDLSDSNRPCMGETQTPKLQVKKKFPRYKFKKFSPRKGNKHQKQARKWTKHPRMQKLIIPESGDAGNKTFNTPLKKSYEGCETWVHHLEKPEFTSGSNADQNLNVYDRQNALKISAAMDSPSFELFDPSQAKIVEMESGNVNKMRENEHLVDFQEDHLPVDDYLSSKVVTSVFETAKISSVVLESAKLMSAEEEKESVIFENIELMSAEEKLTTESENAELLSTEKEKSALLENVELRSSTTKKGHKFNNVEREKRRNFFHISSPWIRNSFACLFKCFGKTRKD